MKRLCDDCGKCVDEFKEEGYECRKDNPKFRDGFKVEPKKVRASIMGWQKVKDI